MKTIKCTPSLFAAVLLSLTQTVLAANDDKYLKAREENIEVVYKSKTPDDLQRSINAFERIAAIATEKWEPLYYQSFGYIMLANLEKEASQKDRYLDLAFAILEKGKTLEPDESEIIALEGFAYMMRVAVDPGTRGAQLAGAAMESFSKALAIDPENPRALVLQAQMQFGTAQFFGASTDEACTNATTALEKFQKPRQDKALAPKWGKGMAEALKQKCQ